jgi:DNA-binding SARP family transcriptional activator
MPCQLLVELLAGIAGDTTIDSAVTQLSEPESYLLSYLAEEMVRSIDRLSEPALGLVSQEAMRRPNRWIYPIREAALLPAASRRAVRLMADIGGSAEASMLRAAATRDKSLRDIASEMTRRLAARVEVDDLGVVALLVGGERNSRRVRRKVLGLLCFVASRPLMAATRDEALDALWPDLAPATAVNSLHQTIYFLGRLLEPEYREGLSAGYLQFDGEVLRLDPDLVDTASRRCWRKIAGWQEGDETQADELVVAYRAKFALDFSYEDWAQSYRENLHAAVLSTAEARIDQLLMRGESDHAAQAAQALLRVDPTADAIELQLLKAYKIGGRHAAAAEQYAHYASIIRDELGADPPALADI